jgi:pimeloyl-ACP methyl ester carboxylesterase
MTALETWWREGERLPLVVGDTERQIFVRRLGSGPAMTLLHGFPSSSHDWAHVAAPLAEHYSLVLPDFLGFGASDKPQDHDYSLHEQADLVEALWAQLGIDSTVLVAHDYAVSVVQELLARRAEGALDVDLVAVHLLNGGLYPDLHRPEPMQTALLDPEQGPQISAAITADLLHAALAPTFSEGYDHAADSADMWQALTRDDGQKLLHLLIRYMLDRRQHAERWVGALETTDVPLAFVWGMLDPISGAHIGARIRERLPLARFAALDDVGHWPPREAPERVVAAIRA